MWRRIMAEKCDRDAELAGQTLIFERNYKQRSIKEIWGGKNHKKIFFI